MTPEELDQSRIRIAGPPKRYDPNQGEKSNFDWMAYQIKELEKILGNEATADWLNRPHSQLCDTPPATVSLDYNDDEGCKAVAQLIADLITDGPYRLNRCRLPPRVRTYISKLKPDELMSRLGTIKKIMWTFGTEFEKTNTSAEGLDVLMECTASMCNVIQDPAWNVMMEMIHKLRKELPDSKNVLAVAMVMDALDFQRKTLGSVTSTQEGNTRYVH